MGGSEFGWRIGTSGEPGQRLPGTLPFSGIRQAPAMDRDPVARMA